MGEQQRRAVAAAQEACAGEWSARLEAGELEVAGRLADLLDTCPWLARPGVREMALLSAEIALDLAALRANENRWGGEAVNVCTARLQGCALFLAFLRVDRAISAWLPLLDDGQDEVLLHAVDMALTRLSSALLIPLLSDPELSSPLEMALSLYGERYGSSEDAAPLAACELGAVWALLDDLRARLDVPLPAAASRVRALLPVAGVASARWDDLRTLVETVLERSQAVLL